MCGFELLEFLFYTKPGRDREEAGVVLHSCVRGGHVVSQAAVEAALRFCPLLPQEQEFFLHDIAVFVFIQQDVVSIRCSGEETEYGPCPQPFLIDDRLEHLARIGKKTGGNFSHQGIFQNGRVAAGQFPGLEKRRPVDQLHQLFQRVILQYMQPRLIGTFQFCIRPVNFQPVGTG